MMKESDPSSALGCPQTAKRLNLFERYLSLWVALCVLSGIALGKFAPAFVGVLRALEFGTGSHHSHDDESGFHRDSGSGQEVQRSAGHIVRERAIPVGRERSAFSTGGGSITTER